MDNKSRESIVQSYIHVVGTDGHNRLSSVRNIIDELTQYMLETETSKLYIHPNFSFNWISGPSGYIADIPVTSQFHADGFQCPMFRNICVYEIEFNSRFKDSVYIEQLRDLCRKTIPIHPQCPMNIESDTDESGWSECLGMNGSSVGIYQARDVSGETQEVYRYFVIVDTGLPETVQDKLQKLAYSVWIEQQPGKDNKTYEDICFKDNSFMQRASALSFENNRRIAYRFTVLAGLKLRSHPIVGDDAYTYPEKSGTESYRKQENIDTSKYGSELTPRIREAIGYFPHASMPISPFTVLERLPMDSDITKEAKASMYPDHVANFPLGSILELIPALSRIEFVKDVNLQSEPMRCKPILRTEYNTYKRVDQHTMRIYNGCCPLPLMGEGIIRPLQVGLGYEIIGSRYFYTTIVDSRRTWDNEYGNGFPIQYKFAYLEDHTKLTAQNRLIYCSAFHGISYESAVAPRQLRGVYQNLSELKSIAADHLQPDGQRASLVMEPMFVYMSPRHHPARSLDILTSDIYKP